MPSFWSKYQVQQLAIIALIFSFVALEPSWAQKTNETPNPVNSASPHGRTVEDWSSLSLAGSKLLPQRPTLGGKDDLPGFTRELIQVKWRVGDPIDLYIIRPKYVPKPRVILYLYSYPSETARFRDNDYCARVTS